MAKCFIRSQTNLINSISIIWKIIKKKENRKINGKCCVLRGMDAICVSGKNNLFGKGKKKFNLSCMKYRRYVCLDIVKGIVKILCSCCLNVSWVEEWLYTYWKIVLRLWHVWKWHTVFFLWMFVLCL